jgi:hypothetical protein
MAPKLQFTNHWRLFASGRGVCLVRRLLRSRRDGLGTLDSGGLPGNSKANLGGKPWFLGLLLFGNSILKAKTSFIYNATKTVFI